MSFSNWRTRPEDAAPSLIDVAIGRTPADLVLRDCRLVNVNTREIEGHIDVAIRKDRVALVGDASHTVGPKTTIIDVKGRFVTPGLIDSHMHIESSMVTPTQFARAVLPLGTTAVFVDSHEMGNPVLPEGTLSFSEVLKRVESGKYPRDYLSSFRPDPEEICHLMPTGGSTGLPKIVPRTHNDFYCNFEYRAKAWQRSPQDITLIATPLTHNMAIEVSMNPTFLTGGKVVLLPSTRPKEILETIEKERVTNTILVVAQLQQIVDFPELHRYDLSSLRVIAGAGSHVPAELIQKIYERLRCKFFNVFGMSEGPCAQTRYEDPQEVILHTVGRPICPYDEFKVIDPQGQTLPPGEEGELVARGPCIFRGYYKAEAENEEAFTADGFFRTGDIARFDPRGNLIITGRRKDIIVRGGEKISAREVEELILSHPKVEMVAAVGMPDKVFGERVCAFIQPKGGESVSFDEIILYLREKKTSVLYLPERVEVIEAMPLTPVGKIDKRRLKEEIQEKLKKEGRI